ncbi:hypothetical protein ESB00_15980 [Oleiharenicola lentus]|jgi:anti-sigma-K factor RskA|uniref:Uncharacterized protein n=1 Tax=Oleiharenicola lentus TaxID=2508720 RepID=A0A4V1M5Z1_9BACT|nr:hypothetical protein [Oleiharenicola lentus]RXK53196.1 hypothetical protein ESB00_15980 [Oleiharenicola lentus]
MDESLQELENELKRLTPRAPSAALMQVIERELGPAATTPASAPARRYTAAHSWQSWKWASWSLAGAAAALLVAFLLWDRPPAVAPESPGVANTASTSLKPVVAATNRYEPVHASSVLYDLHESEPTLLPDRTEGREVRYRYVDTYTWKNPNTNASVRWSVPRDEVRLVRASFD